MNVLSIGYLPKEVGGSYTSGIANVVYALSKTHVKGLQIYTYSSNLPEKKAKRICTFRYQYIGYVKSIIKLTFFIICDFKNLLKERRIIKDVTGISFLRGAFYKYNYIRAIRLTTPDIIHVHAGDLPIVYFAKQNCSIQAPIVLTSHGFFCCKGKNDLKGKTMAQKSVQYADYITALTKDVKLYLTEDLGFDESKVSIIPNGVDTSRFYFDIASRKTIREGYGIPDNTVILITVASIYFLKGQLDFVKFLEDINYPYEYWIFGDGEQRLEIEKYCEEHGLNNKIKLMGYLDNNDVYKYLSAADVYAHVSLAEGQALCELEAYATGIKTILNKAIAGTVAEDPHNEEYYFILDYKNPEKDRLIKWLDTCLDRERVSRSKYDWNSIMTKYYNLYTIITE